MTKLPLLLTLVCISMPSQGQEPRHPWTALANEGACFMHAEFGLDFLSKGDRYENDISALVTFAAPHPGTKDPLQHLEGVSPGPIILKVQLMPSYDLRKINVELSEVRIQLGSEEIPLVHESTRGDPALPSYYLGGEAADRVLTEFLGGGKLAVVLRLTEAGTLRIPIANQRLQLAAAMLGSCQSQYRKTGLK